MSLSKVIFTAVLLLLPMAASADICFQDTSSLSHVSYSPGVLTVSMSCHERDTALLGLEATAITLQLSSLGLLCTGVGTPVSLAVGATSIGIKMIQMIVSRLPCRDHRPSKNEVRRMICNELNEAGLVCDPRRLRMNL